MPSRSNITVAAGRTGTSVTTSHRTGWPNLHAVLAWIDLEMTGLDPQTNVIVEIAALITDDDLNIVAELPGIVIHATDEQLAIMDPVVVEMHTKSGLLDEIKVSTVTLEEAGATALQFLQTHLPGPTQVPLCGNSIGMDRRFLAAYLPDIENFLHYRSVDVSTIKELVRRWYPDLRYGLSKQGTHRALDDIRESVAELVWYRAQVFMQPAASADDVAALPDDTAAAQP
jgi:oligoribonuclease